MIVEFNNSIMSSNLPDTKIYFDGQSPKDGVIIIRKDGKLSYSFHDGKYCAKKNYDQEYPTIFVSTFEECVVEIDIPSIVLLGANPHHIEINSVFIDSGVVATAINGTTITNINIKYQKEGVFIASLPVNAKGEYKVIYTVEDEGVSNFTERTVIVRDTTPPIITIPANSSITIDEVNTFDLLQGVIISDNSLETPSLTVTGGLARIVGSYEITYTARDSSGNSTTVSRFINVNDVDGPIMTLNGNSIINLNLGSSYIELGATAIDAVDGNVTASIVISGTVNTNIVGSHFITYTSKDLSNNETSITRTVNVLDNVPPVIVFGTNGSVAYSRNSGTTVMANDVHATVVSRYYQWTMSTTAPLTETFSNVFSNGDIVPTPTASTGGYYLWIKAIDNSLSEVITRSNIFNLDNTPPVITSIISGTSNITNTSFTITRLGTAIDNHSGLDVNPYIYQTSLDGTNWTTNCTASSSTCIVNGLINGTTYHYRVCASDTLNNQACVESKTEVPFVMDSPEITYLNNTPAENATPCVIGSYTFTHMLDKRDNKTYPVTQIGNQCLFAGNLAYTTPECLAASWTSSAPFNACRANGGTGWSQYEILYQWEAAMNGSTTEGARGLCPLGWHIISDNELKILEMHLELTQVQADATGWRGTNIGRILKSTSPSWGGNNNYGFNFTPAGYRNATGGLWFIGSNGGFWTSTAEGTTEAWGRNAYSIYSTTQRLKNTRAYGGSIRCIFGS